MTFNRNLLSDAVRYGLAAGAVGLFALTSAPANAQDTTTTDQSNKKAKQLDTITVTGSRIKRSQVEGPNPVTIINRKDLEVTGDLSVADVLRSATFNTFGSLRESSGSTGQSQATINLRGVGSQRTLVLLDGRRLVSSPALGGNVANINLIPFAAVERIEILRDGASAIYGSDAIGGVVNIILRKDYEGLQISAGIERPTRHGGPNGNTGSIVGGISSDKGNITFVIDHQERGILFNRDRDNGIPGANPAVGLSAFGFPPTAVLYNSTTGDFDGIKPAPNCPTALGSDPLFPNSVKVGSFCRFNYAATNAREASLKNDSALINANFDLTDNIRAFARINFLSGNSFGVYAPTPITTLPTMSGANPNNPFPGEDLAIFFRFVPGGTRNDTFRDHNLDVLFGLEGQNNWFGGANWSLALHQDNYNITDIGTGYALGPPLQGLIDSGALNPFATNPNDPGLLAGVAQIQHTQVHYSTQRYFGGDGQINFDLFQMPNGPAGFAAGFDYRDEAYSSLVDAQTAAGNVFGTAGGNSSGERAAYALFAELNLPILKNFAVDVAGRFDHYNDFGSSFNPKVSFEFRPVESLLLRADWGKGFRAPSLSELHRAPAQTFTSAVDTLNCPNGHDINGNLPFDPCTANQYQGHLTRGPNLKPETSKSWTAGVVWSPLNDLNLSLDYYNIKLKNQITTLPFQTAVDIDACANPVPGNAPPAAFCASIPDHLPPGAAVIRGPLGNITDIIAPAFNAGGFKTAGLDFDASYKWKTDFGTWNPQLMVTYVTDFKTKVFATSQEQSIFGLAAPKMRATATLNWSKGDFGATLIGNLIGNSKQQISQVEVKVPYYSTWDIQGTWSTPWKGKFSAGIRNIGDRLPPFSSHFPSPHYLNSQYDIYGRVPYLRYEQSF